MTATTAIPVPSSRSPWACRAALAVLVAIVFGRLVGFGYLNWDDHTTIFENPALRPVSAATFVDAWTTPHLSLWVPVTHTFWALLALVGEHPTPNGPAIATWPFRVASLLLHATATLLVFEIVRRLLRGRTLPAVAAAALFAVHPINVEAVAWISGQKDLLAGVLTFASILLAVRFQSRGFAPRAEPDVQTHGPPSGAAATSAAHDRVSLWYPLPIYVFATLAMLAKPQAVVVVAILPLISISVGDGWRIAVRRALPLLPVALIVGIVAKLAQPAPLVAPTPLWQRPLVALDAIGFYVRQILWPATLAIDYGRPPQGVTIAGAAVGAAALAVLGGVAWAVRRRAPLVPIGLAIAALGVAPVLGLVPFEFQKYSTVSDHYAYVSMLGVVLAVTAIFGWESPATCRGSTPDRVDARQVAGLSVLAILIAGCAARSAVRVGEWRDTQTVMAANLRAVPTSLAALRVLAYEASRRGDDANAVGLLRRAVTAHEDDSQAWFNLANTEARRGNDVDASQAYRRAIVLRPDFAPARYNYAVLLIRLGDLGGAEGELSQAQRLDPRGGMIADALRKLRAMRAASRPAS